MCLLALGLWEVGPEGQRGVLVRKGRVTRGVFPVFTQARQVGLFVSVIFVPEVEKGRGDLLWPHMPWEFFCRGMW